VPRYEVYATRWDDPSPIEEIPARDLEFSMPLSEHGECSFTATVEPGWLGWRQAITKDISGVLVARDGVPMWQGWVVSEEETGDRTFSFRAIEWGYYFTATIATPTTYVNENDCRIFRDLIDRAQLLVSSQDVQVVTGSVLGSASSTRTIKAWEDKTVEGEFRSVGDAANGPEWYFGTTGTLDVPVRQLYLGDRLGLTTPQTVLEFVEDTAPAATPESVPTITLLGDLFPGSATFPTRRAGGNVIAKRRTRSGESATATVAVGNGQEAAQVRGTATSSLLSYGWPRMTRTKSYELNGATTLARHAQSDLEKAEGFATGYSLVTLDDEPDWTDVPRGSTVRVSIDTDIYAGPRPLEFDTRLLNLTVRVPDDGPAQVQWDVATVQET
jgi:hypothetical protein